MHTAFANRRWRAGVAIGIVLLILAMIGVAVQATSDQTVGLFEHDAGAFEGYTLFSGLQYTKTYLIDNEGELVHVWDSSGISEYLLEDGSLIHTTNVSNPVIAGGGNTGGIKRLSWDGTPIWEYEYSGPLYRLHHDFEVMPNGNVLMISWELKTSAEAAAAGRDPALLSQGVLYPERIIEVEPTGPTTGNIVWMWNMWDHLVQDFDATKSNFGVVGDHPELIDVNYFDDLQGSEADWIHMNAVDYNEAFDQVVVSARDFSEVWVIDHTTSTAEAAGHTGGDRGKGGDLLYRWGNPEAYRAGAETDQQIFLQHDVHWIDPGLPGAGNILLFDNGDGNPAGDISTVVEFTPPVDGAGNYALTPGEAYGPTAPAWTYNAPTPTDFFSRRQSGADRMPNGNTLTVEGQKGAFTEVETDGTIVWKYINPVNNTGPVFQGSSPSPNNVFRAHRYPLDFSAFDGRDLTPMGPIELAKPTPTPTPLPDTDGDGCGDERENGPDETLGGRRDNTDPWDFYDVDGDRYVSLFDILEVIRRYSPNPVLPYDAAADRGPQDGPNPWDLTAPDGTINLLPDILGVIAQYHHDCR